MKKIITSTILAAFASYGAFAQLGGVQLDPPSGNVCNPMEISLSISGNNFNPTSYLWSTGETSPTIEIVFSGTYTLTVEGNLGNSNNKVTLTRSATYNVLPAPVVTALTPLWVCKDDTVRLQSVSGYDNITWDNGTVGEFFERVMVNPPPGSGPVLDTVRVSYTASITNLCSVKSQHVILRAIRRPPGVGIFYQNKMNISPSDSIPAGLILEYLYPVTYEMTFTEIANPSNVIFYVTAPGSRKAPASMLTPGSAYTVETVPVINGVSYCPGTPSTIGIASISPATSMSSNRLSSWQYPEEGVCTYRVFDLRGQLIMETKSELFNHEWLENITPQILIIHRTGVTSEVVKINHIR